MEYNVSHLLKSQVGTTREYDLDAGYTLPLDDEITATITGGHVRLDRTNVNILARGHVTATVTLICSRCLEPVRVPVSSDFTEQFAPSVDITSGRALPEPGNDLIFTISERHILDLGEAVRQNLVAALPIQPLCRPDCAGLCPVCGANRNAAACGCVVELEDHPFALLPQLLKNGTSGA